MDKVEIYYFSGSGNSLFVAKELQKRIPGTELIPIVKLLSKDAIESDAETVGFVFPNHGMTVPVPVKNFLKKLHLNSAKYTFGVLTRGGTKCFAFDKIGKILKEKGSDLNSFFSLNMATNDPKLKDYEIPTKEKFAEIEAKLFTQLETICKTVVHREISQERDTTHVPSGFLLERLVLLGMLYVERSGVKDYFYADAKCTGCGTCERVCLAGKIRMVDGRPVWQDSVKCFVCYACINYCPMQASQIKDKWYMKSFTNKNGRYPHPYATANDIAEQK